MSENLTSVSKQYHVLVCVYNMGQAIYKKGGKSDKEYSKQKLMLLNGYINQHFETHFQ